MIFKKKEEINKDLRPQEIFSAAEIQRDGETVSKSKLRGKALLLAALFITLAMVVIYILSLFVTGEGAFTVRIGDLTDRNDGKTLSLSETQGFANPQTKLSGIPIDAMDNITYEWLDIDEILSQDGSHNGDNYLAYSFYVSNAGNETLDYNLRMEILKVTRHVDEAIRIMVIRDNTSRIIYAKATEDGGTESYPEGVVNFAEDDLVFEKVREKIGPGEKDKYTIIVWLEGEDAQCKDDILKGIIKMQVVFDVIDDRVDAEF